MNKKKKTSWGKVANWYDSLLSTDDTYQTQVILPNLLRLLNIKEGERILDIACGQGFFSRAFALGGGDVVGSDISKELIDLAKKKAGPKEKYFVAPADSMKANITDGSFDIVTIVLALQNIENLNGVLKEAARALKERGRLFIVLNHPVFRNPKHTAWDFDEKNNIQYRRIDEYLSESKTDIEMTPGGDKKNVTVSFHRSLQLYSKVLAKNNFLIARIEEWNSHKKSEFGPRQKAEDKSRKEIPMFMLIEAVKLVK